MEPMSERASSIARSGYATPHRVLLLAHLVRATGCCGDVCGRVDGMRFGE